MNSEVCIKESYYNKYNRNFYGVFLNIIKLEYFGSRNRVMLFKFYWFDTKKCVKTHLHDFIEIKHNSVLTSNEPFVLIE